MNRIIGHQLVSFLGFVIFSFSVSYSEGEIIVSRFVTVSAGKSVNLECVVPKIPNLRIYWSKNIYQNFTYIAYASKS